MAAPAKIARKIQSRAVFSKSEAQAKMTERFIEGEGTERGGIGMLDAGAFSVVRVGGRMFAYHWNDEYSRWQVGRAADGVPGCVLPIILSVALGALIIIATLAAKNEALENNYAFFAGVYLASIASGVIYAVTARRRYWEKAARFFEKDGSFIAVSADEVRAAVKEADAKMTERKAGGANS